MTSRDPHSEALRNRSGQVNSSDPLVCFLYILLRDHLSAGVVEGILKDPVQDGEWEFSNGYLAEYAKDLKDRLAPSQSSSGVIFG